MKSIVSSAWNFGTHQDESISESDKPNHSSSFQNQGRFSSPFNNQGIFTFPSPDTHKPGDSSDSLASTINGAQIMESLIKYNDSKDSTSPYKMLGEFFEKKNSEPLTDVEIAGVMSLLNHLQQKSDNGVSSEGQITSIHNPSLTRFDKYPNTANMFIPSSDRKSFTSSSDSQQGTLVFRQRFGEGKQASLPHYNPIYSDSQKKSNPPASNFKPRRITHLESLPTPYRPAADVDIYKPHYDVEKDDLDDSETSFANLSGAADLVVAKSENTADIVDTEIPQISQTASTLLELIAPIDDPEEHTTKRTLNDAGFVSPPKTSSQKKFVNPYSSTASRSTSRSHKIRRTEPSFETPSIIKNLENTMPDELGDDSSKELDEPSKTANSSDELFNGDSPALQRKPNIKHLEKYKPTKSSSLRKSLVVEAPDSQKGKELFKPHVKKPQITPQWAAPEGFVDDEDSEMKDEKENHPINGTFSLDAISTNTTTELPEQPSKLNPPQSTGLFKFGSPKEPTQNKKPEPLNPRNDNVEKGETSGSSLFTFGSIVTPTPLPKPDVSFTKPNVSLPPSNTPEKLDKPGDKSDTQTTPFSVSAAAATSTPAPNKVGLFLFGNGSAATSGPSTGMFGSANGKTAPDSAQTGTPNLFFGATQDKPKLPSFGAGKEDPKPFSFGASNGELKQPQASASKEEPKLFSFGASKEEAPSKPVLGLSRKGDSEQGASTLFGNKQATQDLSSGPETAVAQTGEQGGSPLDLASRQTTDTSPDLGFDFVFPESFQVLPPKSGIDQSIVESFKDNDFVF